MPQVYSGLFIKAFSHEKWCSEQCKVMYRGTVKRNVLLHSIFQTNCKQNHKIDNHVSIPKPIWNSVIPQGQIPGGMWGAQCGTGCDGSPAPRAASANRSCSSAAEDWDHSHTPSWAAAKTSFPKWAPGLQRYKTAGVVLESCDRSWQSSGSCCQGAVAEKIPCHRSWQLC